MDVPTYDRLHHPVYGVIEFIGATFLCGGVGGSAFHFARGLRGGGGLAGGLRGALANAPRVAGRLGGYCAVFSALEGGLALARGREDLWNCAPAAAATWGLHGARRGGAPAAALCAILGAGSVLALAKIDRDIMASESRSNWLRCQERMKPAAVGHHPEPHCGSWGSLLPAADAEYK